MIGTNELPAGKRTGQIQESGFRRKLEKMNGRIVPLVITFFIETTTIAVACAIGPGHQKTLVVGMQGK